MNQRATNENKNDNILVTYLEEAKKFECKIASNFSADNYSHL